jgi:predicted Zn-dependent peptidase
MDFGLARGTSLATLVARPRDDHSLDELEAALIDEVSRLGRHGPTPAELDRAKAGSERVWGAQLSTLDGRADQINEFATLLDDPGRVNHELERLQAVTPEAVARAAATWLAPDARAVLDYLAEEDEG